MGDFKDFISESDSYAFKLSGVYHGSGGRTSDFGTGWKLRLIPKSDSANYIIKTWLDRNKGLLRQYKLAWNEGDKHVWTVYTPSGSSEEAKKIARMAAKELGSFIDLGRLYQDADSLIPGTGISARFDMRSEDLPKQREIVDEIERRRSAHNPFPLFYKMFRQQPVFNRGFPNSTAGRDGVPGTAYYAWLAGSIGLLIKNDGDKKTIENMKREADAEIDLIKKVLEERLGNTFGMKEGITGIYPPLYDALASYPSLYINTYTVYIDASVKSKTV